MEDDITRQVDEVESLKSIYDEWTVEDEVARSYSIQILDSVTLYIRLPINYPSEAPPTYQLSGPKLSFNDKKEIARLLEETYLENIGETVIFQWVEAIRAYLNDKKEIEKSISTLEDNNISNHQSGCNSNFCFEQSVPAVHHGDIIVDRKSAFQGHAALVKSVSEVKTVIAYLKENKKIANATHNIYAYRIKKENCEIIFQDCEDDGESQAGKRLLQLLQMMDVNGAVVVVSRWYGGIHLGPDRFRHINNAARQALLSLDLNPKK